ncbi:MAG: hypothetical protein IJS00_03355 [Paludibacteraceae bacterium]|nr:hypothetical protein [Paludibacteraceae bacterium]
MNNLQLRYILCLLFLLTAFTLSAKRPRAYLLGGGHTNYSDRRLDRNGLRTGVYSDVHHLFGFYLNGAYSTSFADMNNVSFKPGGYGVGGGVCYELQYYYLKFQWGLGVEWQDVTNRVADTTFFDDRVVDARDYPYTLRYDFFRRRDRAWDLHAQLPLLIGAGIRGAYFLTGFKIDYRFDFGGTSVKAAGHTSGTYPQFLGQMWEMDNHGMRKNVPIERNDNALKSTWDILVSLEIGYEYGRELGVRSKYRPANGNGKKKWKERYESRLRFAAFVDYGLLNTMPKTDLTLIHIPQDYKWDFPQYQFHHVFSTTDAKNKHLHQFYAGVKLTVLFGTYFDYKCRLCGPFESERDMASPKIPKQKYRHSGTGR